MTSMPDAFPMSQYQTLQHRLKHAMPQFPPALRKAAGHFIDNPGAVATLSMRQLAAATGTSAGNLPRLAKALGYSTYGELRQVYSAHVQEGSIGNFHLRAGVLQHDGAEQGSARMWENFRDAARRNVDAVFSINALQTVEMVADRMVSARTIHVVGMQASLSSAMYAKYLGTMLSEKFRIISGLGGVLADDIADIGERDVLLAVSLRPCSAHTIRIARKARARGAFVAGCTDSEVSPLALTAHAVLLTPDKSPMFFDSYLAVTLLLEVLMGFVTMRSAAAVQRIQEIDLCRAEMGESWSEQDD